MGNKQAHFTEEQLDAYQDCTYFSRKDILRIFTKFRELAPNIVPKEMRNGATQLIKVPYSIIAQMPELKENPLRKRICEVFSEDGLGNMVFDDFLDMFSVFSEAAPREVKSKYAFKIYDFDGDNYLGKEDLARTVTCLTRSELEEEMVSFICDKVLEEADLDDDGQLSYSEFDHVISRAPEFIINFHIRI